MADVKVKEEISTEKQGKSSQTQQKEQWSSPVEFILSCLALAVGLGNVWRFPYICYQNGGGAFLIPYAIMLMFLSLPLLLLELSMAQYSACGPLAVWEASPLFQGVGVGMYIISFITNIYYNIICAWALYYLFASFQAVLPWEGCNHPAHNTENCYSKREAEPCESSNGTWFNQTCYNETYISSFDDENESCNMTSCWNVTYNTLREQLQNSTERRVSPSEEYFNYGVLGRSDVMEDTGPIKWDLCLVLLLAWILIFICISKGIRIGGKVWADAAGQTFFSTNVALGELMSMASYNKFHNNVYRDTLIVGIGNALTSVYAGFAIFSILGYMAHDLGLDVKDVVKSGSGLTFVAYPDIVTRLYPSQLWSALFFLMLLTLGLGSQFIGAENMMTALMDMKPSLRSKRIWVALVFCIVVFLLGLIMTTRSGVYWLELMSYYSGGWSVVLMGLCEAVIYSWVYGARRLTDNIETMVGFRINIYWRICWMFVTPILISIILAVNFYEFTPLSFGDYMLPPWAQGLGWLMAVASVAMIPIVAVIKIGLTYRDPEYVDMTFTQRVRKLMQSSNKWKPSIEKRRDIEPLMAADRKIPGGDLLFTEEKSVELAKLSAI